jgi:ribosomal protein S18 acetylase RimI-like enzyme
MSEFEYFGQGRFLVMGMNHTPHIPPGRYSELRTGGSLKDGWSYIVPADKFVLESEVSISFSDEKLESHVREQTDALRALYLSSATPAKMENSDSLDVEEEDHDCDSSKNNKGTINFIVKRGLQVVGVATYSERTGKLTDVAILPKEVAGTHVGETLVDAVKKHARKIGRSESLIVHPRSSNARALFEGMGFTEIDSEDDKMESKI